MSCPTCQVPNRCASGKCQSGVQAAPAWLFSWFRKLCMLFFLEGSGACTISRLRSGCKEVVIGVHLFRSWSIFAGCCWSSCHDYLHLHAGFALFFDQHSERGGNVSEDADIVQLHVCQAVQFVGMWPSTSVSLVLQTCYRGKASDMVHTTALLSHPLCPDQKSKSLRIVSCVCH